MNYENNSSVGLCKLSGICNAYEGVSSESTVGCSEDKRGISWWMRYLIALVVWMKKLRILFS